MSEFFFFLLYKFLRVEFYLQMETLTHYRTQGYSACVVGPNSSCFFLQALEGEMYPCLCQSVQFWTECYDSKLNSHTVTLTETPSSVGGKKTHYKTKMPHKPEPSLCLCDYLFLMTP